MEGGLITAVKNTALKEQWRSPNSYLTCKSTRDGQFSSTGPLTFYNCLLKSAVHDRWLFCYLGCNV